MSQISFTEQPPASWLARKLDELFGLDLRSLAVTRVGLALIVLCDLAIRAGSLAAHYGDYGVFPLKVLEADWVQSGMWSYSFLSGAIEWQAFLFILHAVVAFMLLIGWKTRFASVMTWCLLLSLHHANPIIIQGGDILLHLLLFIGIFLPWGRYFSVDQALSFKEPPKRTLSFWSAAFLLQLTFMYFFAPFLKTSPIWRDGFGVYYALSIDQLSTPLGEFMLHFPTILMFLTFAVLTVQHTVPFLIFFPYRTELFRSIAIGLLATMHLSFALHMHLGPFSWISLAALAGFLPTRFWDALIPALARRGSGGVAMYYDGDCGFCKRSVYVIRSLLLLPATTIAPAQTNESVYRDLRERDSWVIVAHDGGRHYSYGAAIALVAASPVFFWLAPLMRPALFQRIGERVYRFVAKHRKRACEPEMPETRAPVWLRRIGMAASSLLAIFFITYAFTWNASDTEPFKRFIHMPLEMQGIGRTLGFDQYWAMFAPFPLIDDGWYVIVATHADGRETDLMRDDAPVDWLKPRNVSALYPNERWRKYMMNLWNVDYQRFRKYFLEYTCRHENDVRGASDPITKVELVFMLEKTKPQGEPLSEPTLQLLESRECDVGTVANE